MSWNRRGVRQLRFLASLVIVSAATVPASPVRAADLPSSYVAGAGVDGVGLLFTFDGSTIDPLLSASIPHVAADMSSNTSPRGTATVLHPGAIALIYQDAVPLGCAACAPAANYLPRYPLIARADGTNRHQQVSVGPELANGSGTMRIGGGDMSCTVASDDSSVRCLATGTNIIVPLPAGVAPPSGQPSAANAWRAWRSGLGRALAALGGRPNGTPADDALVRIRSLQATTTTSVDSAAGAAAESEVVLHGVDLFGGLVHRDQVYQQYRAESDGTVGKGSSTVRLLGATLQGIPVTIDERGIRVADQSLVDGKDIDARTAQLAEALETAGFVVRFASARQESSGPNGAVAGDGALFAVSIPVGNPATGATRYRIQQWLGAGRAQAVTAEQARAQSGSETVEPPDGAVGPVASDESAAAMPNSLARSDGGALAEAEPTLTAGGFGDALGAPTGSGAGDVSPADWLGSDPASGSSSEAAAGSQIEGATHRRAGQVAAGRLIGARRGLPRTALLMLFALWQLLGLAAIATGVRVVVAARMA